MNSCLLHIYLHSFGDAFVLIDSTMATRYSLLNDTTILVCKIALVFIAFNMLLAVVTIRLTFFLVDDIEEYKFIQHQKSVAVNTTCVIEKYNVTKKKCYGSRKYMATTCYDEQFKVAYQMANGSRMMGVIESKNASTQAPKEVRAHEISKTLCSIVLELVSIQSLVLYTRSRL
jgi:hypothetical protein